MRNEVKYYFVPPDGIVRTIADGRVFGELMRGLKPDVLHVHGLGFPAEVLVLSELMPDVPILLQDHADRPPRIWRRHLWKRALSVAAGVAFCASTQAQLFVESNLMDRRLPIYEIPESTSRFVPGDQAEARRITGIAGDPCVLWVGHLNENKDPLTVLNAVSQAVRCLPGLQLWCCFGAAPLLSEVRNRIDSDAALRGRVHLLGKVPHCDVEQLMRAADTFVLGSHREGSGYALIEALACGLPPVVSDIPSFRALTGSGVVGRLWPCGAAPKLAAALVEMTARRSPQMRAAVRSHFDDELSLAAVGRKLVDAYQHLATGKQAQRLECK